MMSDFDPHKYVSTRVHGGVREIVSEEAKKIRERVKEKMMDDRLEMSPERMIEALNNEVRLRDMEIERLRTQLSLAKAEIDGIHSLLEDVREDYFKERGLVDGLTQAILDHLDASLDYNRD
jgi:predicted  nucleic acid-binding Zn-ribbon protein